MFDNDKEISSGSGFFVASDIVATNYHVIQVAAKGFIKGYGDEKLYEIIGVVGIDEKNDLALLRIKGVRGKPLRLAANDSAAIGDDVFVISNPKGLEGTFSPGIVSSIRKMQSGNRLQITAPISAGSSGGAVLNKRGEIIGIAAGAVEGGQALNFAIPVAPLRLLILNQRSLLDSEVGATRPKEGIKSASLPPSAGGVGLGVAANSIRTSIPVLAGTIIPGNSGVLVETLNGNIVVESGANIPLNPASNVKVATSYAAFKVFGPDHRFHTNVWTDGSYERETATIHGNLYISGRDPVFKSEDTVRIAHELNRMGIRIIRGDLVVADTFIFDNSVVSGRSSQRLFATLDASKRSAAVNRAWATYRKHSGLYDQLNELPGVTCTGGVYIRTIPRDLRLLFSHESARLRDIVKVMLSYSNTPISEMLGDAVGGPYAISRIVHQDTGTTPMEFHIQTASGLGTNRVSASAMMKLLRAFRSQLANWNMSFADVMPVAGMDQGTLENRFSTGFSRGSVVGKMGSMANTDAGVSSLAGEMNTREGRVLFVIFNQRGGAAQFRKFQDNYLSLIQEQLGGAVPLGYSPVALDSKLAKTRISYPDGRPRLGNQVKIPVTQTEREAKISSSDVGIDIAIVIDDTANLFERFGEVSLSTQLKKGSKLAILDRVPTGDFYNVVDMDTNIEGWIHKQSVSIRLTDKPNPLPRLEEVRVRSDLNPTLSVVNQTDRVLSFRIGGQLYTLATNSERNIQLQPKKYKFYASVPGITPIVGERSFSRGIASTWRFYLTTQK